MAQATVSTITTPTDERAALERLEGVIDRLRNGFVMEGWSVYEAAAERTLTYYRRRAEGMPEHDIEESLAHQFIFSHGQSLDWIWRGDVGPMVCRLAADSEHARQFAPASPVKTVLDGLFELENTVCEARNLALAARMMATSDEMPKEEGAALDTVASGIIDRIDYIEDQRGRLWEALLEPSKAA